MVWNHPILIPSFGFTAGGNLWQCQNKAPDNIWKTYGDLWQSFMVDYHFCPVPPRHLSRECWFPQLPQRQCGTFVLITFSYKSVDICKLPSQTKVAIYLANQYPICNYWKYCSVIAAVRLPQRDIFKITGVSQVTRRHLKSPPPCPWEQLSYTSLPGHLLKTITSKGDRALLHIVSRNSFLSASRIRVELIIRTGHRALVRMVHRYLVTAEYRFIHSDRCHRLTPDYGRRRRMLAHRNQNWNHQQWPHVLFADETIVSSI